MSKGQRAASKSARQSAPPARKLLVKRDEGIAAARPAAAAREAGATWRLEEAKARFSEVVRRAHDQGPQYVTVRGKRAVAIIDAAELERLLPPSPDAIPLVQFLEGLHVEGLDLTRERDLGRDTAL